MNRWELPLEVPEVPKFVRLYVDLTKHAELEIQFAVSAGRPARLHESVTVVGEVKIDPKTRATFKEMDDLPAGLEWAFEHTIIFGPRPLPITRPIDMASAHGQLVATVDARVSHVTSHPAPEVFSMKKPLKITFES